MTRDELLNIFDATIDEARATLQLKNSDYARPDNALFNIGAIGLAGVASRIKDKACRLEILADKEPANEAIFDSVVDIINYAVLYEALRFENKQQGKSIK